MSKIGNFNTQLLHTGLQTEGYFYDPLFDDGDLIKADTLNKQWVLKRPTVSTKSGTKNRCPKQWFSVFTRAVDERL